MIQEESRTSFSKALFQNTEWIWCGKIAEWICKDVVKVGHLKLRIIESTMWRPLLLCMFVSRLYGDLYFSQIHLLNSRKGICELIPTVTCKDHMMAQSMRFCAALMCWLSLWAVIEDPWPSLLHFTNAKWRGFTTIWLAWGIYHHSQAIWLRWDLTIHSKDGFCLGLVHVCPCSSSQERHWCSFKYIKVDSK